MPLLKITTNSHAQDLTPVEFQRELASKAAELVGKKLDYVMTSLEFIEHMTFAGTDEPVAYLEFKNIGTLDNELTSKLSDLFCEAMGTHLNVAPERVYIEFQEAQRHQWGWNHRNFA